MAAILSKERSVKGVFLHRFRGASAEMITAYVSSVLQWLYAWGRLSTNRHVINTEDIVMKQLRTPICAFHLAIFIALSGC